MKKDATFKWDDNDFVNFYTESANFIVLERQRSIRILLEIVAFHFPSLSGLHILDLGCGEGIITKYICDKLRRLLSCTQQEGNGMITSSTGSTGRKAIITNVCTFTS